MRTLAILAGFCLDLAIGDPRWIPHPVRLMGRAVTALEALLRRIFPQTPRGERWGGAVLTLLLPTASFGLSWGVLWLAARASPWLAAGVETFWCCQMLAARDLRDESMRVHRELLRGDLAAARRAVGMIVGRDTAELTPEGVTRAAVETVAENASDGEAAPLFWMALGGAPMAFFYKAVNTMDSMVGYRNERYRHFGTAAARLDDVLNWVPSRLCALLMILVSPLGGLDARGAFSVWRRDRRKHPSPNSAQTESAMAGALGVRLAGDAVYGGVVHHKETLGDPKRPVEPEDIRRANRLMYLSSGAMLLLMLGLRLLLGLPE